MQQDYFIELYTATPSGSGFLSNIPGIACRPVFYRHCRSKWITLAYFLLSQFLLFLVLLLQLRKDDSVYINTLLPFGAALAAGIKGCKVVYHIHETSLKPVLLKSFLTIVADLTAQEVIFVSRYVSGQYHFTGAKTTVVYNSLPEHFAKKALQVTPPDPERPFTVTMLCSLKAYKGIYHFVEIARKLPRFSFELVLNASEQATDSFINEVQPSANCSIYPAQKDTLPFYARAHVVLNLSIPCGWIETFGMTLLEAMQCGRPVICPVAGGVLELVEADRQGYRIDSADKNLICATLERLSADTVLYKTLSAAAIKRSADFSNQTFRKKISHVFNHL